MHKLFKFVHVLVKRNNPSHDAAAEQKSLPTPPPAPKSSTLNTTGALAAKSVQKAGGPRTLSRGMRGSDVLTLQQFLIAQNLLAPDSATSLGVFMEAAVRTFQLKYGIEQTCTVGPRTRVALGQCNLLTTQE